MAKYALPLAFLAAGGFVGGLFTAGAFSSLGASIGLTVGSAFFGPSQSGPAPQLENLRLPNVDLGGYIADFYATNRTAGTWIDAHPDGGIKSVKGEQKVKSGTGKKSSKVKTYNYFLTGGYALGEGLLRVDKIWADTKVIFDRNGSNADKRGYELTSETSGGQVVAELSDGLRLYRGSRKQMPDSVLASLHGGKVSAYRGTAYVVFNNLELAKFGNRIPTITAQVTRVDENGNIINDAAQIVTLHARKAGVPVENLNLTHLQGKTIPGAFQTSRAGARNLIEQIARWHYCGLTEIGGIISDYSRANPQIWRLSYDELGAVEWENGAPKEAAPKFGRERGAAREIPTHVVLRRPDPALDYEIGIVEDIWQTAPSLDGTGTAQYKSEVVEVQIVANDTEAAPRVGVWKDEMLAARVRGSVSLDIERIAVAPGDVIEVPTDETQTNFVALLIEEQTLSTSGLMVCSGAGWDGEIYTRERSLPTNARPRPGVDTYVAPTVAFIDTATLDEDTLDSPVLIVAATTPTGTKRSGTRFDFSSGKRDSFAVEVEDRAVMGYLRGDLPLGNSSVVDWTRTVTVEMIYGELGSADEDDVAQGGPNLMAIGNRLIRFVEAVEDPDTPGLYGLSGICDAEYGTEWTGTVPDGSFCVLLRDETGDIAPGVNQVVLKRGQIGAHWSGKAVSLADDKKIVPREFDFAGNSVKPLAPAGIAVARAFDENGSVTGATLSFQARTRYPDDGFDAFDTGREPRQSDRQFDGLRFRVKLRAGNQTRLARELTGQDVTFDVAFSAAELNAAGLDATNLSGTITPRGVNGDGFAARFSNL